MNKSLFTILALLVLGSTIFLVGRSFRVTKVPHGGTYSCNTCHTNGGGSPLNPFGRDVNSRVTPGGNESFWSAELAALDSDMDGFTNGEELQDPNGTWTEGSDLPGDAALVTNPGDVNSIPTSIFDGSNLFTYELSNNYPNPFNPSTTIKYELAEKSEVSIKIFNIKGEEIQTLVNTEQNAGNYKVDFNAYGLGSGIYIYRIQAGNFVQSKKMTLLK